MMEKVRKNGGLNGMQATDRNEEKRKKEEGQTGLRPRLKSNRFAGGTRQGLAGSSARADGHAKGMRLVLLGWPDANDEINGWMVFVRDCYIYIYINCRYMKYTKYPADF
ncbi:hypothetical protein TWF694_004864 [Orbilia ellipsospora]|uniref:Uncharacterized protein n=1 Tax=Orbilia ellipsospora TaxID=2528407 RepID=A0AAV9WTX2_9PEZI